MVFGIGDTVYITGGMLNNIQQITTIGSKIGRVTIDEITEVKRVDNVSIKAFPCPKVNDKGLTGAWWWADLIAIAVTVWATAEAWKAAKEEYKIGKRYFDLAKEQWDFFYKYYRPLEDQELNEIWAELPYNPDYSTATKGHTHLIDAVFASADKHRMSLANKYCVCPDVSQFTKTDIMKSTIKGDSDNFGRRYAEKLAQEKNDIRWARRIAAASRGRGLLSASTSFATKAAGFFSDYAQAMGGLAQSAAQFSGYVRNRFRTEYNPVRHRIDSRADVPNFYNGMDTLKAVDEMKMYESIGRGGLSWGSNMGRDGVHWGSQESAAPFMQSGFDPSGYARSAPAT